MTIGVDAAVLAVKDERLKVGVYHYALNLLINLSKIDKKNKYILFSFDPIPNDLLDKLGVNFVNKVLRPKKGWLSLRLSVEFFIHKPHIFLGLGQALPLYHSCQNIIFVYDLAFELFPKFYDKSYKKLSRQTRYAVRHADKIIAISKATKKDLVKLYGVSEEKIQVIYPGIKPSILYEKIKEDEKKYNQYFLFVGSNKPGKNILNIIKAFKLFSKTSEKQYKLILAGSDYWKKFNLSNDKNIKILRFVSEDKLASLYKKATAFISPSYYEGFGMPILEAMSLGVPVVVSGCGSIPEVVGKAAITVDPDDIVSLGDAMRNIAGDKNLRLTLAKEGIKQVKKFSWEKSAKQLFMMIDEL